MTQRVVTIPPKVSIEHLTVARALLATGVSLRDAANQLGLLPSELDLALWRALGKR
jgi:thermostable 8-oxoguanine DNA glycosylase